jgi:hypothetical protein
MFNCVFVLIAIFIYESAIFPAMQTICTVTPLRRMCVGGLVAGSAFVLGGLLQVKLYYF